MCLSGGRRQEWSAQSWRQCWRSSEQCHLPEPCTSRHHTESGNKKILYIKTELNLIFQITMAWDLWGERRSRMGLTLCWFVCKELNSSYTRFLISVRGCLAGTHRRVTVRGRYGQNRGGSGLVVGYILGVGSHKGWRMLIPQSLNADRRLTALQTRATQVIRTHTELQNQKQNFSHAQY